MLFNSFQFFLFLPIVFVLYWFVFSKNKSTQNVFLLIASYVFYSFWDWRFSFLLAFSTILDFSTGLIIEKADSHLKKRRWMRFSILTNLGLLAYFKYTNFFIDSFIDLFNVIGIHSDPYTLNIILPVGISFYTFHGVSYVLDIYFGRIKPHQNIVDYSLFVSYFPLLVSGPIERATHLLPQIKEKREFGYVQGVEGLKLIIWGLFKKIVIADSLAPVVNEIFQNYQNHSSITLIIGVIGFAFQVYGDFSGYTDIARGVSKLLGIELILNFNFPYFSKSIPEFWSKWHISLSSWLNDYVFTPLALRFRNWGRQGVFMAVTLTFLISGFWHGAAWHFVIWGALHAIYYIPSIYSKKGLKSMVKKKVELISFTDLPKIIITFSFVCFGYVFFRADSLLIAFNYIEIIIIDFISNPAQLFLLPMGVKIVYFSAIFLILELLIFNYKLFSKKVFWLSLLLIEIQFCYDLFYSVDIPNTFIYFQF